jgi:hypothetical protein
MALRMVRSFRKGRHEGDLRRVAGGAETLVEREEDWIVTGCGERGPVQGAPHRAAAAANHPAAPQGATVPVEGRDPDQGGNLPAAELPQFGEFGDERGGRNRTHAGHGAEQVLRLSTHRAGADGVVQIRLEVAQRALQPGDVGVDAALQPAIPGQAPPIGLGPEHLDQLTAAGDELAEALGVFARQRADDRAHGLGKASDDLDVQGVSLGEHPGGAGEIPDLAGVDDGDRQTGAGQGGRHGGLVAPRGFEDDQRGPQRLQPRPELGQPGLIVGDHEGLSGGANVDIEVVLGDIETDEEMVHAPSL